jgi:hypothetical protein
MAMSLRFRSADAEPSMDDLAVFLSASIPDPERWKGDADPLEITDAVVAFARVFLTAGLRVVTAVHPTIAPLLLYVAAELPRQRPESVVIYQSQLFEDVLPSATRRFEADGVGSIIWTVAADGDRPEPGKWDASLAIMRRQMFKETDPAAAVFVGGMSGISDECALYEDLFPGRPVYPIGTPGGEARALVKESTSPLRKELARSSVYPALWRDVLRDVTGRDSSEGRLN